MAVKRLISSRRLRFSGLSSDVKPSLELDNVGSSFLEEDTNSNFWWDGVAWVPLTVRPE